MPSGSPWILEVTCITPAYLLSGPKGPNILNEAQTREGRLFKGQAAVQTALPLGPVSQQIPCT